MIDLRSDTVTRPTPAMRRAMAEAEVGDDVYREDPTVNRLEQRAAEIMGKEAALFVPTGTMGNTIAIKLHTDHGQEVICDARSHLVEFELSMIAWFSGCIPRMVSPPDGLPRWVHFRPALRSFGYNNAPTACLEIENTHNLRGGRVYPLADIDEICSEAHTRNLKVHMDGARVFNAAEALGTSVARIVRDADTVMFCLSKALGAPVGSILAGTASDMARARLYRKRLGGGMRQAGVLAAAGLIAIEQHPAKLRQDHANARLIADLIAGLPGVRFDPRSVETNMVVFDVEQTGLAPEAILAGLKQRGVLFVRMSEWELRAATHYDVTEEECRIAAAALADVLSAATGPAKTR